MTQFLDFIDDDVTESVIPEQPSMTVAQSAVGASHLLTSTEDWSWEQVRDYVMKQIEHFHGVQRRDQVKENSIFKSFYSRWGVQSGTIARYAFEVRKGVWKSAPVSVTRFCRASDPFFATEIARHLNR